MGGEGGGIGTGRWGGGSDVKTIETVFHYEKTT